MSGRGKPIQRFHERGFSVSRDAVFSRAGLVTCLPSSSWGSRARGSPQALGRMKAFYFRTLFLRGLGHWGLETCLLPTPSPSLLSAHHTVSPCGFWKDFVLGTILRPMITRHPAPSSPARCLWFHRETGPSKQALPFPSSRRQKRNLTTAGS